MDRSTERIVGFVFLGLMVLFLVLAVTLAEDTPTTLTLLLIGSVIFLGAGIFMVSGGRGDDDGQSQQQSVVLGDGGLVTQQFGGGRKCPACGRGVQASFAHCPHCGAPQAR